MSIHVQTSGSVPQYCLKAPKHVMSFVLSSSGVSINILNKEQICWVHKHLHWTCSKFTIDLNKKEWEKTRFLRGYTGFISNMPLTQQMLLLSSQFSRGTEYKFKKLLISPLLKTISYKQILLNNGDLCDVKMLILTNIGWSKHFSSFQWIDNIKWSNNITYSILSLFICRYTSGFYISRI